MLNSSYCKPYLNRCVMFQDFKNKLHTRMLPSPTYTGPQDPFEPSYESHAEYHTPSSDDALPLTKTPVAGRSTKLVPTVTLPSIKTAIKDLQGDTITPPSTSPQVAPLVPPFDGILNEPLTSEACLQQQSEHLTDLERLELAQPPFTAALHAPSEPAPLIYFIGRPTSKCDCTTSTGPNYGHPLYSKDATTYSYATQGTMTTGVITF